MACYDAEGKDPFYSTNILESQDRENQHVYYATTFSYAGPADENTLLCFDGVDSLSEIYLNGQLAGTTDNMLIPHEIPVGHLLRQGGNELVVHFYPPCIVARQYEITPDNYAIKYSYEALHIRKAPHMYGWDITPRIVDCGIWKDVEIRQRPPARINNLLFHTWPIGFDTQSAVMGLVYSLHIDQDRLDGYVLEIKGRCGDATFHANEKVRYTSGRFTFPVYGAKYWNAKGQGEPNLYATSVVLYDNGKEVDRQELSVGIRTVALCRTDTVDEPDGGRFEFIVNGEKVLIMGTNWVPVDVFHYRDRSRLPQHLALLEESGANMVRCWGGNVYEDDAFYDFCDTHGILVWQDFSMACAVYPQSDEFGEKIQKEVRTVVERLRNHPCLALWSGDNECDDAYIWRGMLSCDPNHNRVSRQFVARMVRQYDPTRAYLPSSPYISPHGFANGIHDRLTERHLWGARNYYKSDFYRNPVALFISEIGYHGCPSPHSIARFISPERMWPHDNDDWMVHATSMELDKTAPYGQRNELMFTQVAAVFGTVPDSLDEFVLASQIVQAEALKFFVENMRIADKNSGGIMLWNLIDGWPQFSDAMVDYDYNKKLAFYFVQRSQQGLCVMMGEPDGDIHRLIAHNNTRNEYLVSYSVRDMKTGQSICASSAVVPPYNRVELGQVKHIPGYQTLYDIQFQYDGVAGHNHYLCGEPEFDLRTVASWYAKADLLKGDVEQIYQTAIAQISLQAAN